MCGLQTLMGAEGEDSNSRQSDNRRSFVEPEADLKFSEVLHVAVLKPFN